MDEAQRLTCLRELFVLDSAPEPVFDSIAQLASQVCGVPIALISLVDAERQWFKANVGLPGVNETPRDVAFCAHAVMGEEIFEIPDATRDLRFADNPFVAGDPDIRFYAGAPLVMPGGERVGTLCVIDRQARHLTEAQAQTLRSLATVATQALEMRRELFTRCMSVRTEYEQALQHSEARHRALVEDQIELVSLATQDGELIYVNLAYASHFGRTPNEMIGANLLDFVEAVDRDAVKALIAKVLTSGRSASTENRMVAAQGQERWVAWTNSVQRGLEGELLLHSVGRDVTDRKVVELALRASQAFLARTGRVAGVGGWELEVATGVLAWSDETRRIHEVAADFVPLVDNAIDFYVPEARPVIEAAVKQGMLTGQPWDLELQIISAKGRRRWVRAVGSAEFEGGVPIRLAGAFQDITHRKELERRLTDSERLLRLTTDSLPLRIAYLDKDKRYQFVNLAQCERFGRVREEILGRSRSELLGVTADSAVEAHFDVALSGQAQRFEYDDVIAGRPCRIEALLIPDVSEDGEVRGLITAGIDITERSANERALRELNAIFANTTDFVVQADKRGKITYLNRAVREASGLRAEDPVSHLDFSEFNSARTNRLYREVIIPAVRAKNVWVGETSVCFNRNHETPVSHMVIAHRDGSGRIERYSAIMRDISEQLHAKQMLQRQTATLRSITEAVPAVIAVVGADGRYRFVNSAFERWSGTHRDNIVGRTLTEVLGRTEAERSRPWVRRVLGGESVSFEKEYSAHHAVSHMAVSYIPTWLEGGSVDGFVAIAHDISEHKRKEDRLQQLSHRDALTGLLNRSGYDEYIEQTLVRVDGRSIALLYIDLDRFKPVNDTHGHAVGDAVLRQFAGRLTDLVRPTDAIARLGGDEFAIVLPGIRVIEDASAVADKIIAGMAEPFLVGPLSLKVGASVGTALGVDPSAGWRSLAERADAALYGAKNSGRGRQFAEAR